MLDGEPTAVRRVARDAAGFLPGLPFPEAGPSVMPAERTFREKATAIHVHCRREHRRGERLSRHRHDLALSDDAGAADRALADRVLAPSVARHKAMFFPETDAADGRIDDEAAVAGGLEDDYAKVVADGPHHDAAY